MPTPLNVIDLLDLMWRTGYFGNIERGPGRDGISNAFHIKVRDSDGHRVEIYRSDDQAVDRHHGPICWEPQDHQRQTLRGAPAPRSWFDEGSPFAGATPIVAP